MFRPPPALDRPAHLTRATVARAVGQWRSGRRWRGARQAFTLIEVLLALAIAGLLMTAALFFLTSVAQLWAQRDDGRFLPEHLRGAMGFLTHCVERAQPVTGSSVPVSWARPPGTTDLEDLRLAWTLRDTPALLAAPDRPTPGVSLYLDFPREGGLWLVWHARLQPPETAAGAGDDDAAATVETFRTLVTPYLTKVQYGRYLPEEERWDESDFPPESPDGVRFVPDYLRLTFTTDRQTTERLLFLPPATTHAPRF